MQIIYGILGLGLVVFIHEAGHFLAARAVGIDVEVFSLGWGRKLFGFRRGKTEYRISMIPLGGFVKMKGESAYQNAVENDLQQIQPEEGSFFSAAPWRRIIVALAGPFMNLLFALIVLSVIQFTGYEYQSFSNQILLQDEYPDNAMVELPSPASQAGLRSGDRIISVNGVPTPNYSLLQQELGVRALDRVELEVERDGSVLAMESELLLNEQTGSGELGILPLIEPVLDQGLNESIQGLEPGDRILEVNGVPVSNSIELRRELDKIPITARQATVELEIERGGSRLTIEQALILNEDGNRLQLGYYFMQETFTLASGSLPEAVADAWNEIISTLSMTFKGLGLLFRGLDPMSALSGPIRITMIVGEVTAQGLTQGLAAGLRSFFHLLSLLSVALFFGNLLPIPVLDGGQVVIALTEWLRRNPLSPKAFFRYQTIGAVIVFALILFVIFSDIMYVFRQ